MGAAWTEEQIDQVRLLRRQLVSHKHIGRLLNRSTNAIMAKAREIGAVKGRGKTPRPPPTISMDQITIEKAELSEFYIRGWRVAWFDGNEVGLARRIG